MKFTSFLFFFFIVLSLFAQNDYVSTINEFAEANVQAMIDQDLEKRMSFMHPNIIAMGGGAESLKSILEEEKKSLATQKILVKNASFGSPGKVVQAGNELHCILPQKLFLTFQGKDAEQSTNLLAASLDDGKTWKFVDLNQHDKESIKVFFPYFHKDLLAVFDQN